MKRKILIIIENAFSFAGTENVCNFMTECYGQDHEVTVLSLRGAGETFYDFKYVKQIISLEAFDESKFNIFKYVNKIKPDHVFIISMGKLSIIYALLSLIRFRSLRNTFACEHVSFSSFPLHVKFLKVMLLRFYRSVVVLTDRDSIKLKNLGIKNVRISNPIKFNNYTRTTKNKIVLAVGRLEHQKGFDRLIDIWAIFNKKHPEWILKIAGIGSMKDELIDQVNKNKLSNSIHFLGKVNNVDELYKASGIYAMTSRYEGLPMVLLEAKSWSLPVISFDCPTGPREIITDHIDGFLISDNDIEEFARILCSLAEDDDKYHKISSNAIVTSKKFSAEKIKKKWEELIIN